MCKKKKKGGRHKVKSSEIMTVRFHSTDWLKKLSTSAKFKRWPDYQVKVISLSAPTATQFKVLRYIIYARVTNLHLSYMRTALCTSKSEMINFLYILLAFKPSNLVRFCSSPFRGVRCHGLLCLLQAIPLHTPDRSSPFTFFQMSEHMLNLSHIFYSEFVRVSALYKNSLSWR